MTITTAKRTITLGRGKLSTIAAALVLVITSLIVAACSNQLNDLGGINQASPDYALTYLNVSSFPNITLVCIKGVGFATTTRSGTDLVMVPEWDSFCQSKELSSPRPAPSSTSNQGN